MVVYPAAFLARMEELLGDEYEAFCDALERAPERGLRLNPLRGLELGGEAVPWEPDGRYLAEALRPGRDLRHFSGAYYMQDPSAMAPARALDAQPGELVLDLCAAPGGKSGQLAAAMGGRGALVSNEPDLGRARALAGNLERLGVRNALITSAYPAALARAWPEMFDAVLVDAPCSGEGMFRRDEAVRAQWSAGAPLGCAQRQVQILRDAVRMLRRGGRLVYSTCTFNELENEGVVRTLLAEHPELAPMEFALAGIGRADCGMLRLWPHRIRGEGQFVAMLRKWGGDASARSGAALRDAGAAVALEMLRTEVAGSWPAMIEGWVMRVRGDSLCALPPELPAFDGVKVLRAGLQLCRIGRGFVKPDRALAMALTPEQVERALALDDDGARRFVRGEELPCPDALSGWTLVLHERMPLGWGKAVHGKLKNHTPKGVRLNP